MFYTVDDLEYDLTIWVSISLSEISSLYTDYRSIFSVLNFILEELELQRQILKYIKITHKINSLNIRHSKI